MPECNNIKFYSYKRKLLNPKRLSGAVNSSKVLAKES